MMFFIKFDNKVKCLNGFKNPEVVPYVFPIVVDNQNEFLSYLQKNEIDGQIHYSVNLHELSFLPKKNTTNLPKTEFLNSHVVSIPIFPTLTDEQVEYVIKIVLEYFKK